MDDAERTARVMEGGYYRTGDVARRDADGYFTYVGRADDVFKSSDYRLSPFELESALIEHPSVAEAAVVPSPDPIRWNVPKAFLTLVPGSTALAGAGERDFRLHSRTPGTLQARAANRILRSARRPFPARSAACSCALSNRNRASRADAAKANTGKKIFRS